MNKINRATQNIFLLINRLTKEKKNSFVTLFIFLYIIIFKCNWSVITQVPYMHTHNISALLALYFSH